LEKGDGKQQLAGVTMCGRQRHSGITGLVRTILFLFIQIFPKAILFEMVKRWPSGAQKISNKIWNYRELNKE
jgi:hypothetical protein